MKDVVMGLQERAKLLVMEMPVSRAAEAIRGAAERGLRDGSTGQLIRMRAPMRVVPEEKKAPERVRLERVWAVEDTVAGAGGTRQVAGDTARPEGTRDEDLVFYRKHTEALLRRYLQLSLTSGRVPSLMGREIFRGRSSHYRTSTLEDVVIFCYDVEQRLGKLRPVEQRLLSRIAMQRYTQAETAVMMGLSLRHMVRQYGQALDALTRLLLEAGLLKPLFGCQGTEAG
jgi:hypothetical protein